MSYSYELPVHNYLMTFVDLDSTIQTSLWCKLNLFVLLLISMTENLWVWI